MYTTYNIGRREKESKIVNMAKTFLRRLLLFISGCYGCNEHAHQFLLAQREKKRKESGPWRLVIGRRFWLWMAEEVREPVLSTIKRERAHRKEEEAELRVHIITVGSLLLPLFFHSPGSGDLGDPCCSRTIVTRGWERPTPFQLGGESKREHRKKVTTLVRQRMLNHPNVVTKWTDHNTSIHDTNFFFPFNLR